MKHTSSGFGIVAIIITVAIVAALGGGAYYTVKKTTKQPKQATNTEVQGNSTITPSVFGQKSSASIRSLLSLNKTAVCTISYATSSASVSGTVYIDGLSMRGDFVMQGDSVGTVESHMIKKGTVMHAWTGTQGATFDLASVNDDSSVSVKGGGAVNLDQNVAYKCGDWKKDDAQFIVPANVKFTDVSAFLNTQSKTTVGGGVTGSVGNTSSQCVACASLPTTAAVSQCKMALQCN